MPETATKQSAGLTHTTSKTINAPIEKVFDAWLDPAMLTKFMIPGEGMSVVKAEIDAKVGGRYHIVMVAGEDEIPHTGTYLEIVRPTRLVFTWESSMVLDGSSVELDFKPLDDGTTEVQLTHTRFIDEEGRDRHAQGWGGILAKLAEVTG